ncbi:MAG: hypothetical protein DWQ11_03500 [Proteobacteria bacterium]|nr:MAG: hypothetical protein DWQ11_03500 [Pseudomonadota bacterium]
MPRLSPHARHPAPPGLQLTADAHLDASTGLTLRYALSGPVDRLAIPPLRLATPADGLWQHTCFEAFVALGGAAGYREFNFSPSRQWAVYDFDSYRQRSAAPAPRWSANSRVSNEPAALGLQVTIPPSLLPAGGREPLQLALTAVLEDRDGRLSYWALRHPAAQPDFHHREGFALMLTVDSRP